MFEEKWQAYAKAWSQPDDVCETSLNGLVTVDVTYADPNSEIVGRSAFSAHMSQFRKDVPGAYFEIIDVKGHHSKTLARWRLCGKDGGEMMQGTSFATTTNDGKFTEFSGFF